MNRSAVIAAIVIALWATAPVYGEDVAIGGLKISAAWARATPKAASVGGGYLTITNIGTAPDRLMSGSSDVSSRFEIHEMGMDNGIMKMRPLAAGLEIKPGQTVEFKPGGYHLMFVGLNKPLEQGQHIKATLQFEKAGSVTVDFAVEGIGAQTGGGSPMPGGTQMQHGH